MPSPPAFIWINGSVVATQDARLSPLDHGFTVGDGVFETLTARQSQVFALARHWQRLAHACQTLGIPVPEMNLMRTALTAVMRANELTEARLRFTVTSGEGTPGSQPGNRPATHIAMATDLPSWPATEKVITVPWTRNENGALAGLKCTSYAENIRALRAASAAGAGEAVWGNTQGDLCEGSGSNIFVVIEGVIVTPPLSSGCLAGVTRALVMEACLAAALPFREGLVTMREFGGVEEAFLTSSTRNVHVIAEIDGRSLKRAPGALTQRAANAFAEYASSVTD
ncbi:MAG: branched-chain amino acid aminotransferase/4-amino-4-deoxychorismate lyase [Verrucomicrobiaceae bacterium]|nr:branched-chain amino acid aminotransferase/4-amino-4-deoxychorismate lyase [Verrucomicrobiaceae bacterium]